MILTDREIQVFLANRQISIKPKPDAVRYSSTSVDLTLAKQLRIFSFDQIEKTKGEIITPGPKFKYTKFRDKYTKSINIPSGKGYVLEPEAFVLAWTHETIDLPNRSRIAARVEGKSSLARLGLAVHVTAPTIHAGFEGPLQSQPNQSGHLRNVSKRQIVPLAQTDWIRVAYLQARSKSKTIWQAYAIVLTVLFVALLLASLWLFTQWRFLMQSKP